MKNKIAFLLLVINPAGFTYSQTNPTLEDLRDYPNLHHVYDSLNPRSVLYLMISSEHPTDVAAKVRIIREHQYNLDIYLRDFIQALAQKYNVKGEDIQDLFEADNYTAFTQNPLLSRMTWADLFLLSYLSDYSDYVRLMYEDELSKAGNNRAANEFLAYYSFTKSNNRIPALLLLNMKSRGGIVNPCHLYSFYQLYENASYSNDTTWLSYEEEVELRQFYTVYQTHCTNTPFPLKVSKDWMEEPGNDDILFDNGSPEITQSDKGLPDLIVENIEMPDYASEINGTRLTVTITNKSKGASGECVIRMTNGEREVPDAGWLQTIPPLKPGKTEEIVLLIPNHWVFNPNAFITVTIDCFNDVMESNEKNNTYLYQMQG